MTFENTHQSAMLYVRKPLAAKCVTKVVTRRHDDYYGNRFLKISFNVTVVTVRTTDISKNSIRVLPFSTLRDTVTNTTPLS